MSALRAMTRARLELIWNRVSKGSGSVALVSGTLVLLFGIACLIPAAYMFSVFGRQLPLIDDGAGPGGISMRWLATLHALLIIGLGIAAGLRQNRGFDRELLRSLPLRTSHLLIAELPFGLLDTIPILGLTCFGGLAIGLMQSHPGSPAVVLLVTGLSMLSVLLTQQFVGVIKRLAARPRGFAMVAASAGVPAIALVGFVASQGLRPGLLQVLEWLPTSIGMHALKAWELGDTGTGVGYLGLSIALVAALAAGTTWLLFKDLSIDPPLNLARRGKENLWSFEHPRAGMARLFVAQVFGAKYGKILAILPFFVTGGFVIAAVKIEHVAKGSVFEKLFVEAQTYPLYALVPPLIVALAGGVWMNQFAWHGRGIKALLLAPLRSRDILDGNLLALLGMLVPLSLLACLPLVYLDFAPPQAVPLATGADANLAMGVAAELATGTAASVLVVCVLGTLGHLFSVRFPRQLSESGTGVASAPFTLQLTSTAAVGVLGLVGIGIYAGLAGLYALAPVAAFVLLTAVVLVLRQVFMPRLVRVFDAGRENLSETLA